jgi:hypothetical protein
VGIRVRKKHEVISVLGDELVCSLVPSCARTVMTASFQAPEPDGHTVGELFSYRGVAQMSNKLESNARQEREGCVHFHAL